MTMIVRIISALWGVLCSAVRVVAVGVIVASIAVGGFALADYTATQGSGTTFASLVLSTKHYMAMVICDATAGESQCSAVTAGGAQVVDTAASGNLYSAVTAAVPCLNATAATTNTYTTGQTNPANCDLHGNLYANVGASALPAGAATSANQTTWQGATGGAPPTDAAYLGANASGATGGHIAGLIICDSHIFKHITSATDTLAVQGVTSQSVYICGWRSRAAGTATWFLENTASVNANCSSANTQITGLASEVANSGEVLTPGFWSGLKNTSGNGLCINSTGTGGVDVDIWYAQF